MGSWNARALVHHDATTRDRQFRHLQSYLGQGTVMCIQEVHGNAIECMQELHRYHVHAQVFMNFGDRRDTGGT
eukprot:7563452-Pyramimonas_sp.AAC.1